MKKKLSELDLIHKEYTLKFPFSLWTDEYKEQIKIDHTHYSNKIEGNKVNYGDTVSYLKGQNLIQKSSIKDLMDLKNYKVVLDTIFLTFNTNLTTETIKSLHGKLMEDPRQFADERGVIVYDVENIIGDYRETDTFGTRRDGYNDKEYLSPYEIDKAMKKLLMDYHKERQEGITPPLVSITKFHYKFANEIHPFKDGNGRMIRLLSTFELLKSNYPPLMITNKENYLDSIVESEQQKSINPLLNLFIEDLKLTMEQKLSQDKEISTDKNKGMSM